MNSNLLKIGVIGGGAWGTTLANLLAKKGYKITIWVREPEIVEKINTIRINEYFLPNIQLSNNVYAVSDIVKAVENKDLVVLSIPSKYLRLTIKPIAELLKKVKYIINTAKGLELDTGARLSQVILDELNIKEFSSLDKLAVLSGPNLAYEIANERLSACVIASPDENTAKTLQEVFYTPYFRTYRHTDRIGVELGGTLKNIFAIGAGIVDGLALGDNAKATYLTRSLHEMVKLGTKLGGNKTTFYGLSGLGDLIATSSSNLSRNYQYGLALAKSPEEAEKFLSGRVVVEGVITTKMARDLGQKLSISLPITEELYKVIFEKYSPISAINNLMLRSLKYEHDEN